MESNDQVSGIGYKYAPLPDAKSIRLLLLNPSTINTEVLHGTFEICSLEGDLDFEALSYTWGEPEFPRVIEIGEHTIAITENLFAALKRFRLEDKTRKLWIDAICISQSDDREKSSQVALMAEIYRRAKVVLGWLGDGDEASTKALDHFGELAKSAPHFGLDREVGHRIYLQNPGKLPRGTEAEVSTLLHAAKAHKVELIYSRPWFTRIWIVQEVVLAREIVLFSGNTSIRWPVFAAAVSLLLQAQMTIDVRVVNLTAFNMAWDIVTVRGQRYLLASRPLKKPVEYDTASQRSTFAQQHQTLLGRIHGDLLLGNSNEQIKEHLTDVDRPSFLDTGSMERHNTVIATFWKRDCKNDRDRIYGMLGVCPWDVQIGITPDYSLPVVDVYVDYALRFLERDNIAILNFAGIWNRKATTLPSEDHDTCPSWVPEHRISKLKIRDPTPPWGSARMHPLWEYCQSQVMFPKKPSRTSRVSIEGIIIGAIQFGVCSAGSLDPLAVIQALSVFLPKVQEVSTGGIYQLTGEPWFHAVAKTLDFDPDKPPHETIELLVQLLNNHEQVVVIMDAIETISVDSNTRILLNGAQDRELIDLASRLRNLYSSWSFITTTEGHIGLAPGLVDSNDVLVAFCGLPGPYLVRPVRETLDAQLVGPCYIHGMMNEEYEFGDDYRWISLV